MKLALAVGEEHFEQEDAAIENVTGNLPADFAKALAQSIIDGQHRRMCTLESATADA